MSRSVAVLLYHHIGPTRQPSCRGLTVSSEAFARQMSALSAMGYKTVSASHWVAHTRGERELPELAVMLTFDDAYADLIVHAFPVLLRYGFTATVFVPTSLAGGEIPCNPRHPEASLALMSKSEIAEWSARGVEFGAHSRTHPDLTTLTDDELSNEICGSGDDLSDLLERPVISFAYPYGRSDQRTRDVASRRFGAAFGIEEGLNDVSTPLDNLRRTMVQHGDTVVDICLRARYGRSVLDNVRKAAANKRWRRK